MRDTLNDILSSRINRSQLFSLFDAHPEKLEEAILLALSNKQPYAWRASWILSHYMKTNDPRFLEYSTELIKAIRFKKDGHQRELIRILQKLDLNDDNEGLLFDECMTIWESINKRPSVRIFAFKFIVDMVKKYPELNNEIKHLTQSQYQETLSPGLLRSFERLNSELVRFA